LYAIIEDGGKQYKVQQGETICVEQRAGGEDQESLQFDKVLFYRSDETTQVGQPYLAGARVIGQVRAKADGPKLYPMQFRRRKNSRRRIGHRQRYLEVEITEIVAK